MLYISDGSTSIVCNVYLRIYYLSQMTGRETFTKSYRGLVSHIWGQNDGKWWESPINHCWKFLFWVPDQSSKIQNEQLGQAKKMGEKSDFKVWCTKTHRFWPFYFYFQKLAIFPWQWRLEKKTGHTVISDLLFLNFCNIDFLLESMPYFFFFEFQKWNFWHIWRANCVRLLDT